VHRQLTAQERAAKRDAWVRLGEEHRFVKCFTDVESTLDPASCVWQVRGPGFDLALADMAVSPASASAERLLADAQLLFGQVRRRQEATRREREQRQSGRNTPGQGQGRGRTASAFSGLWSSSSDDEDGGGIRGSDSDRSGGDSGSGSDSPHRGKRMPARRHGADDPSAAAAFAESLEKMAQERRRRREAALDGAAAAASERAAPGPSVASAAEPTRLAAALLQRGSMPWDKAEAEAKADAGAGAATEAEEEAEAEDGSLAAEVEAALASAAESLAFALESTRWQDLCSELLRRQLASVSHVHASVLETVRVEGGGRALRAFLGVAADLGGCVRRLRAQNASLLAQKARWALQTEGVEAEVRRRSAEAKARLGAEFEAQRAVLVDGLAESNRRVERLTESLRTLNAAFRRVRGEDEVHRVADLRDRCARLESALADKDGEVEALLPLRDQLRDCQGELAAARESERALRQEVASLHAEAARHALVATTTAQVQNDRRVSEAVLAVRVVGSHEDRVALTENDVARSVAMQKGWEDLALTRVQHSHGNPRQQPHAARKAGAAEAEAPSPDHHRPGQAAVPLLPLHGPTSPGQQHQQQSQLSPPGRDSMALSRPGTAGGAALQDPASPAALFQPLRGGWGGIADPLGVRSTHIPVTTYTATSYLCPKCNQNLTALTGNNTKDALAEHKAMDLVQLLCGKGVGDTEGDGAGATGGASGAINAMPCAAFRLLLPALPPIPPALVQRVKTAAAAATVNSPGRLSTPLTSSTARGLSSNGSASFLASGSLEPSIAARVLRSLSVPHPTRPVPWVRWVMRAILLSKLREDALTGFARPEAAVFGTRKTRWPEFVYAWFDDKPRPASAMESHHDTVRRHLAHARKVETPSTIVAEFAPGFVMAIGALEESSRLDAVSVLKRGVGSYVGQDGNRVARSLLATEMVKDLKPDMPVGQVSLRGGGLVKTSATGALEPLTVDWGMSPADENRWAFFFGLRALARDDAEAKLFFGMLDERYGEDDAAFTLFAIHTLQSALPCPLPFGPTWATCDLAHVPPMLVDDDTIAATRVLLQENADRKSAIAVEAAAQVAAGADVVQMPGLARAPEPALEIPVDHIWIPLRAAYLTASRVLARAPEEERLDTLLRIKARSLLAKDRLLVRAEELPGLSPSIVEYLRGLGGDIAKAAKVYDPHYIDTLNAEREAEKKKRGKGSKPVDPAPAPGSAPDATAGDATGEATHERCIDFFVLIRLLALEFREEQVRRRATIKQMFDLCLTSDKNKNAMSAASGGVALISGEALKPHAEGVSVRQFFAIVSIIAPNYPPLAVASLYKDAWIFGKGRVDYESFSVAAEIQHFFSACLRLPAPAIPHRPSALTTVQQTNLAHICAARVTCLDRDMKPWLSQLPASWTRLVAHARDALSMELVTAFEPALIDVEDPSVSLANAKVVPSPRKTGGATTTNQPKEPAKPSAPAIAAPPPVHRPKATKTSGCVDGRRAVTAYRNYLNVLLYLRALNRSDHGEAGGPLGVKTIENEFASLEEVIRADAPAFAPTAHTLKRVYASGSKKHPFALLQKQTESAPGSVHVSQLPATIGIDTFACDPAVMRASHESVRKLDRARTLAASLRISWGLGNAFKAKIRSGHKKAA
jgi:hypothetical protein